MERRWSPSELSGGKLCEIVYTILDGFAKANYASSPAKPKDFPTACRALEQHGHVPRSFQILVPRMLPALYEVRNNRGVGHAGGDVDPNHMDAQVVLAMCNWVMAELVRVFHSVTVDQAQKVVDTLAERRIPMVWKDDDIRRVLNPKVKMPDQILVLLASAAGKVTVAELQQWVEQSDKAYFLRTLRALHKKRYVELSSDQQQIQVLPPGATHVEVLIAKLTK